MKKKIELSMAVALILCAAVLAKKSSIFVQSPSPTPEEITIVIDAGHGGNDPGKVGINEALEKDINLSIALKLKDTLEAENLHIILTREDDSSLAPVDATNQKVADMQARCKLIEETNPLFTISIHQNSYITEEATGAQVFYYTQSDEGKKIAESLQESFLTNLDQTNTRETKSNDSYFLLKKTPTPTVIVECGFLSNYNEAELLLTEEYQDAIVNAIRLGILNYLSDTMPTLLPHE